jgi:peptidyl serine alpha-galactosyltransferase
LKHWLENAQPPVQDGVAIALLDPDMIFVRPLTTKMRGQPNNLYARNLKESDIMEKVAIGKPVAQMYGLGAPWTNDFHKKFNRTYICGAGSPCLKPNPSFGEAHYAVGPPYVAIKEDMVKIAKTWTEFVPRVYEHYPYLLAEMYAYSMAAAHEDLPHLQMEHFMVSNTDAGGEGWPLVDKLNDACVPPVDGIYFPGTPLPTVVHYCQNFRAANLGFAKRQVHRNIFSCDHPLMVEPPADLSSVKYRIKDGQRQDLGAKQVKRNAYVLCVIHRSLNSALKYYKERMCAGGNSTNYEKTYNALPQG